MKLLGTTGRIDVDVPFNAPETGPSVLVIDDGRDLAGSGSETVQFPAANQFVLQGDAFVDAIRGLRVAPVTLEDSIGNMAVLDALFRSAESGRWESP